MPIRGSIRGSFPPGPPLPPEERPIRFGTDGWRGRIAEEITLSGMRRCAAGISAYLRDAGKAGTPVAVGYDGRFLSPRFAAEVAHHHRHLGGADAGDLDPELGRGGRSRCSPQSPEDTEELAPRHGTKRRGGVGRRGHR